jgi:hypothetical protein
MQTLTPEDHQRLQAELAPGESILWAGKPNPKVIFHPSDWGVIPFSLLWAGFFIFWELGVSGYGPMAGKGSPSPFLLLWGIPFIIMGQYFIWGRFFYTAWKKARVLYAITNRRALVTVRPPQATVVSAFIDSLPTIEKTLRSDGIGIVSFGARPPAIAARGQKTASMDGLYLNCDFPVFVDIDDAQTVYALVTGMRASAIRTA